MSYRWEGRDMKMLRKPKLNAQFYQELSAMVRAHFWRKDFPVLSNHFEYFFVHKTFRIYFVY